MILQLKKDYFTEIFCTIYAIALVLSYEIHVFDFQPIPQLIAYGFLLIVIFINFKSLMIYKNLPMIMVVFLFFWLLLSLLIRLGLDSGEDGGDVLKILAVFLIFFSYLLCPTRVIENIFKLFFYIIFFSSLFNVVLFVSGGKFILWEAIYGTRYASFYYLHNFAGALFGFQLIYSIYDKDISKFFRVLNIFLSVFSLIFSFSKGSIVAVFLAIFIASFSFSSLSFKIIPTALGVLSIFALYVFMDELQAAFPRFRFFSGLNERDEMWEAAFGVLDDTKLMLLGGGEPYLHNMIEGIGKDYLSTHNYFVDTLVTNGAISFFLLISLSLIVVYGLRYKSKSKLFFTLAIYLLISANKSRFSLGGVTLLSVMLSFVFVYAIQTWGGGNPKIKNLK